MQILLVQNNGHVVPAAVAVGDQRSRNPVWGLQGFAANFFADDRNLHSPGAATVRQPELVRASRDDGLDVSRVMWAAPILLTGPAANLNHLLPVAPGGRVSRGLTLPWVPASVPNQMKGDLR
jgi:hypothetical protein